MNLTIVEFKDNDTSGGAMQYVNMNLTIVEFKESYM